MQQLLTQACTAVINIANNCLEVGKPSKTIESGALVTKASDAITIMGMLNTMLNNERKSRLKPPLSENYQDFSQSVYLLGDDLPEELRKGKSRHFLEVTRGTSTKSTKKRPSTSSESLNYQGRKKIYSGPQYQQLRQNQQNSLLRYQKRN